MKSLKGLKPIFYSLLIFCACLSWRCSEDREKVPDIAEIEVELEVHRLEDDLFALESKEDIKAYLEAHPLVAEQYFFLSRYPESDMLIEQIHKFISLNENDTLYQDVKRIFGDFEAQKAEIEKAFRFVKYYYPDFKAPKIYTSISGYAAFGFGQDVLIQQDIIVLGLDFFAGAEATYRPPGMPQYLLERLTPEHLVPTLIKLMSARFNAYKGSDKSLLADMVFYGKSLFFTKRMLPYHQDTLIIGYSGQQLADCYHNEEHIWRHFVQEDLIYETKSFTKEKYVGERPKVQEISKNCPGRIGRWVGWRILESFRQEHPELTLPEIMKIQDARSLFQRSRYRPVNP